VAIHGTDFIVLLAFSLMLLSTRIGWYRRLKLFGCASAALATLQILACATWIKMAAAQELQASQQVSVLLPGELRAVELAEFVLEGLGHPSMFALFLLAMVWNSGWGVSASVDVVADAKTVKRRAGRHGFRSRSRLWVGVGLVVALASVSGWAVWRLSRESDPRHIQAHATIGHMFWAEGNKVGAEKQYERAAAGGTIDPEVFFNLAKLAAWDGRTGESRRFLQRSAELATDPAMKRRVEQALNPGAGTQPESPLSSKPPAPPRSAPADVTRVPSR
jgi:hypothetical protein